MARDTSTIGQSKAADLPKLRCPAVAPERSDELTDAGWVPTTSFPCAALDRYDPLPCHRIRRGSPFVRL